MASILTPNGQLQQVQITSSVAAPQQQQQQQQQPQTSQSVTVQTSEGQQPLTITGLSNGQQYTVIPAVNQVRASTNLGNVIHVPNIQTIPTVQNIPGKHNLVGMVNPNAFVLS